MIGLGLRGDIQGSAASVAVSTTKAERINRAVNMAGWI